MRTPAFTRLFGDRPKTIVGMIHVRALPGAPKHAGGMAPILDQALAEAETYRACGIHALMVENMHDVPYVQHPGPEILAAMAVAARAVKQAQPQLPLGIQNVQHPLGPRHPQGRTAVAAQVQAAKQAFEHRGVNRIAHQAIGLAHGTLIQRPRGRNALPRLAQAPLVLYQGLQASI